MPLLNVPSWNELWQSLGMKAPQSALPKVESNGYGDAPFSAHILAWNQAQNKEADYQATNTIPGQESTSNYELIKQNPGQALSAGIKYVVRNYSGYVLAGIAVYLVIKKVRK